MWEMLARRVDVVISEIAVMDKLSPSMVDFVVELVSAPSSGSRRLVPGEHRSRRPLTMVLSQSEVILTYYKDHYLISIGTAIIVIVVAFGCGKAPLLWDGS